MNLIGLGRRSLQVNPDHDVRAHGPNYVGRHIADQPSVNVNVFFISHRGEESGDGHGGAHGGGERSVLEHSLFPAYQVGGYAAERRRQVVERLYVQ